MKIIVEIKISDAEIIALKDAINVYKDFIREQIGEEIKAPYWARLQSIKEIETKLNKKLDELL
jgi:hypothetical protein